MRETDTNKSKDAKNDHPLGPLFYQSPSQASARTRTKAVFVLLLTAALITTAAWLTPDPKGFGTHTQLGQSRCGWPQSYGIPCPTCGMTTAFSLVVRGKLSRAFCAQPFGAILALGTCLGLAHSLCALFTGRSWRLNWYRCPPRRVVICSVLLVAAAWLYKILATRSQMG